MMKALNCFSFSIIVLFCTSIGRTQTACPQPDIPTDGTYTPQQKKFDLGDEIIYSCNKGFALAGKDRRICKSYGGWSDYAPFCDRSVRLSDPSITNPGDVPPSISRVIDGTTKTCFEWRNATGQHLYLHLDTEVVVQTVKIFLMKGVTKLQILTGLNNNMKFCHEYDSYIETDRWIQFQCNSSVVADTMKILVIRNKHLSVCEIQVYGREAKSMKRSSNRKSDGFLFLFTDTVQTDCQDCRKTSCTALLKTLNPEDGCDRPPSTIVPYGHFKVSRTKAVLICDDSYKSLTNRLVCEGNSTWSRGGSLRCDEILCDPMSPAGLSGGKWTFPVNTKKISIGTKSELKCHSDYRKEGYPDTVVCQKNGTWTKTNATCIGTENAKPSTRAIIFGSVGVAIVLVVVALLATTIHFIRKQRNKEVVVVYQSPADGSFPLAESEVEYSSTRYEPLKPRPPEPPSTPRPAPSFATIGRGENKKTEEWKTNLINHPPPPPHIMFGTMKPSTIYGN